MQIKKLSLTNFRAFEQAEFDFQPNMNLIVGINGAGKSTVLDALRFLLAKTLPKISAAKEFEISISIQQGDISVGTSLLSAELSFEYANEIFNYAENKSRDLYSQNVRPITPDDEFAHHIKGEKLRKLRYKDADGFDELNTYKFKMGGKDFSGFQKDTTPQPLVIYFSTHRSIPDGSVPSKNATVGGQAAAFAKSLSERELQWKELAEWWRVQEELGSSESPIKLKHLQVLRKAAILFLDNCNNLQVKYEPLPEKRDKNGDLVEQKPDIQMYIEKNGVIINVRQLSDGERGILSLILDLGKRLSLANPFLEDPLTDGVAVVLIDELDLHLHPRWQRDVVQKLTSTFQNCQFIATTHSPQIVGEVSPENIIILEAGKAPYRPDQSLGMDTNWILRFLMGTDERKPEVKKEFEQIADLIENEEYDQATEMIDQARRKYGENSDLVRLQTRIDRIRLLGE